MFTVMAHFHPLAFSRKVDYLKLMPISFGVAVPLASLRVNKVFCLLQNQHQKIMLKDVCLVLQPSTSGPEQRTSTEIPSSKRKA